MRPNNIKAAVLGICLAASAGVAHAQAPAQPPMTVSRGYYVGVLMGQSEAKEYNCQSLPQCENRGGVARVLAGKQFERNWSVEAAYVNLGTVSSGDTSTGFNETVKARLGDISLVASYPGSGRLMVYGRGGAYYASTTLDRPSAAVNKKVSNGGFTWGLGLQYFVRDGWAVRGEAQRYMKVGGGGLGESEYNALTLGVVYKMR